MIGVNCSTPNMPRLLTVNVGAGPRRLAGASAGDRLDGAHDESRGVAGVGVRHDAEQEVAPVVDGQADVAAAAAQEPVALPDGVESRMADQGVRGRGEHGVGERRRQPAGLHPPDGGHRGVCAGPAVQRHGRGRGRAERHRARGGATGGGPADLLQVVAGRRAARRRGGARRGRRDGDPVRGRGRGGRGGSGRVVVAVDRRVDVPPDDPSPGARAAQGLEREASLGGQPPGERRDAQPPAGRVRAGRARAGRVVAGPAGAGRVRAGPVARHRDDGEDVARRDRRPLRSPDVTEDARGRGLDRDVGLVGGEVAHALARLDGVAGTLVPGDDLERLDGEADFRDGELDAHVPVKRGGRLSRKADMPSCWSSLAKRSANSCRA
jgi:hypothetical protein